MEGVPPILLAGLTGCISGFLLSIPVGPVNLTIMNEGARRGFKWAALIGLGASFMEVVYCFIAFTGFASVLTLRYVKTAMELFTFVFLLFLGIKFLLTKSVNPHLPLGKIGDKFEAQIEARLHPHSAFMIGVVRVMGNVGVLVWWVLFATYFISHEWVSPDWPGKLACVAGVAIGVCAFYLGLAFGASRGHGKFTDKTLLRMAQWSGVGLLTLAFINGGVLFMRMVHHKP